MWIEEETEKCESRKQRDYVRDMNDLINAERERVLRIMKRIDKSMEAVRKTQRITGKNTPESDR